MCTISNTVIMASAGSGKTYALNSRMIALLALDQTPERIVALTFTKAAAGEIFDELIKRLARASTDPSRTAEENALLRAAGIPEAGADRYAELLRILLRGMHVSRIGTLDSFLAAVVRAFPLELGISANYAIMDDHVAAVTQERILRRLLASPRNDQEEQARQAFADAFRQATFGQDGKTVLGMLHDFVEKRHGFLLLAPDRACWGNAAAIWPTGSPWYGWIPDSQEITTVCAALLQELAQGQPPMSEEQLAKWQEFCDTAQNFSMARVTSNAPVMYFLTNNILPAVDDLESGAATITVARRKMALDKAACRCVLRLLYHITGSYLRNRLECTQGLAVVLQRYEDEYENMARRAGRLAFADLTHLINRAALWGNDPGASANRCLDLEYRLDGQYDHWALDEFQDTSRQQWAAVRNLVDEVVQDPSGRRTFFMVGDVKQAIYGWRGGDSRLMAEIADRYELQRQDLDVSFRSCPDVLAAVNSVFQGIAANPNLPEQARDEWASVWRTHESEASLKTQSGCTMLLETSDEEVPNATPIVELLRQIAPWERGLEAAVLVRGNDYGKDLTAALRQAGIPVVWEGDKTIAGHPLVGAVLALFRYVAHPGDTLAREHLRMTPLAALLADPQFSISSFLEAVYAQGFAAVINSIRRDLTARNVPADAPEVRAFVSSAEAFDAGGSRDCLDFVQYIESFTAKDAPPAGHVRVMTIHHSKGLGFDLVFLPFGKYGGGITSLDTQGMLCRERESAGDVVAAAGAARQMEWLLDKPGFVGKHDPTLMAALDQQMARDCFEELCVLYVAMTRAKRGLYMFTPPPPKKGESVRLQDVVRSGLPVVGQATTMVLGGLPAELLYRQGDETWYTQTTPIETAAPGTPVGLPGDVAAAPRYPRVLPSRLSAEKASSRAFLFAAPVPGAGYGPEFGTALHALCAQMEWFDSGSVEEAVSRWRSESDLPQQQADLVEAQFRKALAVPEIQEALRKPAAEAQDPWLWREQSFDVILDGQWVTGTFDRVVVRRDKAGNPREVEVFDFKSDNVTKASDIAATAERYRPQIELYRRALAQAFGLSLERIRAALIFTAPGRRVKLA
jgi:ATP-dependent exoDNAse (exonuclease V) beta subunit